MIDAGQARTVAETALEGLERDLGTPLAVWDGQFGVQPVTDHGDVWVVMWNSVEYLSTGDFMKQQLAGPIVVPKDGRDWFVLGTALPLTEQLAQWRAAEASDD
jgi:hypothetical protein